MSSEAWITEPKGHSCIPIDPRELETKSTEKDGVVWSSAFTRVIFLLF